MNPLDAEALVNATRARLASMEKWAAEDERKLLVDGGTVKNANGGRTVVRWAHRVPNMTELERLGDELAHRVSTLEKLRTIKSRKRAVRRVDHAKARAQLELAGTENVAGYTTDAKRRPVALRIFYQSEGGEILASESDPMTLADANRTAGPAWERFGWALDVSIQPATPRANASGQIRELAIPLELRERLAMASDVKPWRAALKTIPTHARFVLWPAQRTEPVETSENLELFPTAPTCPCEGDYCTDPVCDR